MSDPTNEPSRIPTGEPTKRTELPSILSTKSKLLFTFEKMNGSCQQLTHAADSEGVTLAALHLPGHKYVGIQQMSSLKSFDGNSISTNDNPAKHDSAINISMQNTIIANQTQIPDAANGSTLIRFLVPFKSCSQLLSNNSDNFKLMTNTVEFSDKSDSFPGPFHETSLLAP